MNHHGQLSDAGYAVIPDAVEPGEVDGLLARIQTQVNPTAGTRRLIDTPWCEALAIQIARDTRVQPLLPENAKAIQCTLFNKSLETNWLVPLHQDLSIPVADRVNSPHCSGWSEKEGELFVQPPVQLLEEMLAIRLHLDDSDDRNGALRVVAGSHKLGRLNSIDARRQRDQQLG